MKTNRVKLAEWLGDYTDGYVDIPWPLVHGQAGDEQIRWLNKQDPSHVQMVLEKEKDEPAQQTLWAEFYRPETHIEYALRFAK
jgi:hypothetical protein